MIDTSPGTDPNNIHDLVLEDNLLIITNTKELFEEQDGQENMKVESKMMLLSPFKGVLQVWKHHGIDLWSPLQELMQNQKYLASCPTCTISFCPWSPSVWTIVHLPRPLTSICTQL
jgi:hypothetical protein